MEPVTGRNADSVGKESDLLKIGGEIGHPFVRDIGRRSGVQGAHNDSVGVGQNIVVTEIGPEEEFLCNRSSLAWWGGTRAVLLTGMPGWNLISKGIQMKKAFCFLILFGLALTAGTLAVSTPPELLGRWVNGTTSATNYWASSGAFMGNAQGTGQVYEFHPDGSYRHYAVIEMQSYGMLTRVRTFTEGTVSFSGQEFSLAPVSGHYYSEMGSKVTDRAMNSEDLAKATKTYPYRLESDGQGRKHFLIPFDDGSGYDFVPSES